MWHVNLALAETSAGQEVAEQMGELIDSASATAGNILSKLPAITTKLAIAVVISVLGMVLLRIGKGLISRLVRRRGDKGTQTAQQMKTLRSLLSSTYSYIVYFIMATVVLSLFGVNVSSLLAIAGVGGVAISFGAQTLVKDVISGLFIWAEGSIAVGDWVSINDLEGTVESIAIRTTVIRSFNGNLYTIPNGDIRTITNMSRDFKRAIVDIRCPYEADQQELVRIIEEEMVKAGEEIEGISTKPDVLSIIAFDTDAVLARVAVACPVGEHWRIEREIRTRIKARFDREGIIMPHYPMPKAKVD